MLGELAEGMTPAGQLHIAVLVVVVGVLLTLPHILANRKGR